MANNRKKSKIPSPVLRRLTKYLSYIQGLKKTGEDWIFSHEIAGALGLTSSTVRQDLSFIEFSGISKRGYELAGLEKILTEVLGSDSKWNVVIVGAGNLGRALARHNEFREKGFNICGFFDKSLDKIGRRAGRLVILHTRKLREFIKRNNVAIGIITVPNSAAQEVADMLVVSGVKGILNFTSAHIVVHRRVAYVEARIVACLHELSHAIKMIKS